MDNEILRHSEPSSLDQSTYGTRCKVVKGNEFDMYVQMNHDDSHPNWVFVNSYPLDCPQIVIDDQINFILGRI